tara:strand:+ start:132 stop:968 length:837 start_codon:yes stop_codon:yes gene_type:complete
MKYQGKNNEYFETATVDQYTKALIETSKSSELTLIYFESDGNKIKIDNIDYTFNQNDVVCFTEFHRVEVKEIKQGKLIKWDKQFYCVINHDSEVGCKGILFYGATTLPVIHPSQADIDLITLVWAMLEHEMASHDSLQQEMLQMMLKRLIIICTRIYKNQIDINELENKNIDIIREYYFLVEQHFKEKFSVLEYSDLLHKSPKTLSNIFKKLGSKPPLQYIKDRRMLEAKRLLSYTDLQISEIGYQLGFSDIQSFSRFFKREEGIAPKDFKISLLGKN